MSNLIVRSESRFNSSISKSLVTAVITVLFLTLVVSRSFGQSCVSSPSGLVSWWAADTDAHDNMGINNGRLNVGVGFSPGLVGQAFNFDGSSTSVIIPDSPSIRFTNAMTVEAWIYPRAVGDQYHEIISKWDGGYSYTMTIHPNSGQMGFTVNSANAGMIEVLSPGAVPANQWTHVAGTYDGATLSLYFNGVLQSSQAWPYGIYPSTTTLVIGAALSGSYFDGLIDELSVYNRALSDTEIQNIYSAGSAGKCALPPKIITQPVNQIAHVGMQVAFNVLAVGGQLSYQWQYDSADIPGATNSILLLNNVQTIQSGPYSVIVSNVVGATYSSSATLDVREPCISAAQGMTAWWPAEGDVTDHFGDNNGYLAGGAGFDAGESGQAFSFDGATGYVGIYPSDATDLGAADGMTVECWIYPTNTTHAQAIVEWNDNAGNVGVHIHHSNSGIGGLRSIFASLVDLDGNDHVLATLPNLVVTNAFQHVAVTYDKTTGTAFIYLNGNMAASANLGTFRPQTTYPLAIGARTSGLYDAYFAGRIDEMAFYKRALTASEIQSIYLAGSLAKACSPPEIVTQPQSARGKAGVNFTFSVGARGSFPLAYQWLLDGTPLVGATNNSIAVANAQPSDAGNYSVQVSNSFGAVLSSNALLKVDVVLAYTNGQPLLGPQVILANPLTITLNNAYPGGLIFYTLDGSEPTFSSTQYSGPFTVSKNSILRALGYSVDFFESGELDPVAIVFPPKFALTRSTAGGGTVSVSPASGPYLSGTVVAITATPASGWTFLQWLGDASGHNAATNVTMTRNKSVTAVFGTTLTTTAAGGGSVSINPPGGIYPYGTTVWLTGIPQSGKTFALWGNAASGNVNPLAFTLTNANPTVSSLFSSVTAGQAALAVVPVGNGKVNISPQANTYAVNASVTITATPDAGQTFTGWSGDASGTQNPLSITMNQNKTIYANFTHGAKLSISGAFDGLKSDGFGLSLVGDYGAAYEIDGSTDLSTWTNLGTVTNFAGTFQFFDPMATNSAARFYRAVLLQ